MGFKSVYRALQEVFPKVDARLLRAVAIEHSKDADAAVEAILVEVIPYLSARSTAPCSSNENEVLLDSSRVVEDANNTTDTNDGVLSGSTCLDEALSGFSYYDANAGHDHLRVDNGNEEVIFLGKHAESSVNVDHDTCSPISSIILIHDNDNGAKVGRDLDYGDTESEELISVGKCQESSVNIGSDQSPHTPLASHSSGSMNNNLNLYAELENLDGPSACDSNHVVAVAPSMVQELTPCAPENSLQLVVVPDLSDPIVSFADASKNGSVSEMADLEDEPNLNTLATRSGQICRIDLLEEIIADARSNKNILFSAVESVLRLMREVELQEKAAEEAKEEAARGGLDILTKVEDFKQMSSHEKEANNMHAGEVYGEKAILATEVREIQIRLLCLSDERDKSLAILEEMRHTLEARLAAAEKEREAAEKEKLGKEECARNALAELELLMEKIVEESKKLKQEAEENSKLQEFVMEHGRIVDTLQGEISVICKDVRLLKENFDDRVPLSKSLSSSSTSCMLASSSSSLKSMAPDQVPEQSDPSEIPNRTSPSASTFSEAERTGDDDLKALVDDGWEFFDNREFYM